MTTRDDIPTLLAAGVLGYVGETLLHEAAGHGGACLAEGHRILVLAPLWMRCSHTDLPLTASGPAMNVLAAVVFYSVLQAWRTSPPAMALLLWLGFAFNALVACGYLAVGAATGFGDWPMIFAGLSPAWLWRVPALLGAVCGYYVCLRIAARLYVGFTGGGASAARDLWRRALYPAAGAAFVACLAEIAGGRIAVTPLLLALSCTALVGYSLTSMDDVVVSARRESLNFVVIRRTPWVIFTGIAVAGLFVFLVGPGVDFHP